jgi:nephrocystin-3
MPTKPKPPFVSDKRAERISVPRTIRLFLSSTFRDFGEERDLLVRQVFPALRARLNDRFVELVDVDLRWGITVEQAERGEVLPICLAEIDRARPYFIGMLGERYGWIPPPDGFAPDLIERQPWLKRHQGGKSVTELEILHGVLNNRRMKGRAFFYFRSPGYAKAKGGDYVPASPEDRSRQCDLKRRIQASGYPVAGYRDPESLAKRLERDLWKLLDAEFPAASVPDAFEREAMRHEAYATPRRRLYLGGERYQAQLASALESGEQRVVIEGASGGGKSALLANFFGAYRKRHGMHLVHEHYLGASADAADPNALVRRLIEFIQRATGSTEDIPGDPQKLMDSLPIWLATASAWARKRKTCFIFVLDSLNSLTEQQDLRWWPAFLPRGITMLVSCLPGPVHDALKGKTEALPEQDKPPQWKTVTVRPLTKAQSATLLNTYLARFNKKLPKQMVKQVQAHSLSTNPLFLRTLAEELRLFGVHEELQKRLDHYLTSQTIDDLFERVLERVEKDCGKKQVKAAMTALWASRAGLTEKEILGVAKITPVLWATMRHMLDEPLLEINGRINFAHDYIRIGVKDRYAHTPESQQLAHLELARYFSRLPIGSRRAEEEPFQWQHSLSWRLLRDCLTNLEMFQAIHSYSGAGELMGYWILIEQNLNVSISDSYQNAFKRSWRRRPGATMLDVFKRLQEFLDHAGIVDEFAVAVSQKAVKLASAIGRCDTKVYLEAVNRSAILYSHRYEFVLAESSYLQVLARLRRSKRENDIALLLTNLSVLYQDQDKLESAEESARESLELARREPYKHSGDEWLSLHNLGCILNKRGSYSEALKLHKQALKTAIRSKGSEHPNTATSLNALGHVFFRLRHLKEAERLIRSAFEIREKCLGRNHILTNESRNNLAYLMQSNGKLRDAEPLYRIVLAAYESSYGSSHPHTSTILRNLGSLLIDLDRIDEAQGILERSLRIAEDNLGQEHSDVATTLKHLARIAVKKENNLLAINLQKRALIILSDTLGDLHPNVVTTRKTFEEMAALNR